MAKIILFDLDETLLDFKKCEAAALIAMLNAVGAPATEENIALYSQINDSMWKRLERGELTRSQIRVMRFEDFFSQLQIKADPVRAQRLYECALSTQCFFTDGAKELLLRLYGKYDMYIVSNGTAHVQDGRIAASGIAKYFKDIFISDKIGVNKPSKDFFDYCASHIAGFDKSRAIIVGDSPSSDIAGGINAGITTCRYNPQGLENPEDAVPDYEISKLSQLDDILKVFFNE